MSSSETTVELTSSMLNKVMDDIGINNEIIQRRRDTYLTIQEMFNLNFFKYYNKKCIYVFGSQIEGSTTFELQSDTDFLFYQDTFNIVQTDSDVETDRVNFIMVNNENTDAGYALLRLHDSGLAWYYRMTPDYENEMEESNDGAYLKTTALRKFMQLEDGERFQGPAICSDGELDFVFSFKCASWPKESLEWFEKQRPNNWPSPTLLEEAKDDGYFLVTSKMNDADTNSNKLKWRITYSLTERRLMFSLNITQMRCYVLMKIMKKEFLKGLDASRGLTSYHLKTVLFHTIESVPDVRWEDHNILLCLTECFKTLVKMAKKGNCPHFINPDVNLFIDKMDGSELEDLHKKVCTILEGNFKCLLDIQIDSIGRRLISQSRTMNTDISVPSKEDIRLEIARYLMNALKSVRYDIEQKDDWYIWFEMYILMFEKPLGINAAAVMSLLPVQLRNWASAREAAFHSMEFEISEVSLTYLNFGKNHDKLSTGLKIASIYYGKGNFLKAADVLNELLSKYVINDDTSVRMEFFGSLRFFRDESKWCPAPLVFEIYHANATCLAHCRTKCPLKKDFVEVDSIPYLFFLKYLTFMQLHYWKERKNIPNEINFFSKASEYINLLKTYETFENRYGCRSETVFISLGQCVEDRNDTERALFYYSEALRIKPDNVSARLCIIRLLFSEWRKRKFCR